ncbi:MAG: nucleotidyltransferase family protein [Prevotellaceae bacterium]|nr:nucleotidyltransferase family protein [Prevotellaceae bacterium]
MINIILAAGYATRMYPLTENFPKPLLQIGDKTILDRLVEDVDKFDEITEHVLVTNHKFASIFNEWKEKAACTKPITIIDDGSTTNDNRIGAVRDLLLALSTLKKKEPLLVVAADNILDFSLKGFVEYYAEKQTSLIMCHNEEKKENLQRTGVVCLDENNKVLLMEEKPKEPKSHWAVPPFYIYSDKDYELILNCIENGCGFDAPGNLAHYLCDKSVMHAWEMPGKRYDIGNLEVYEKYKNGI